MKRRTWAFLVLAVVLASILTWRFSWYESIAPRPPESRLTPAMSVSDHDPTKASGIASLDSAREERAKPVLSALGLVRDSVSKRPISRFEVRYFPVDQRGYELEGRQQQVAYSTETGRFAMENLARGYWTFVAKAENYQSRPIERVRIEDRAIAELTFDLLAGVHVAGNVVEEGTGSPIAGARITFGMRAARFDPDARVSDFLVITSDSQGRFAIDGLPEGSNTLEVDASGYARRRITIESPADSFVNVELGFGGTVTGEVLGPSHSVGISADVRLEDSTTGIGVGAQADDRGRFEFRALAYGSYRVSASSLAGNAAAVVVVVSERNSRPHVTLLTDHVGIVTGRVLGLDVNGRVRVMAIRDKTTLASAQAGADGTYVLSGLPSGTCRLLAFHADGRTANREVNVSSESETSVDFDFTGGGRLFGQIVGAPDNNEGLVVRATSVQPSQRLSATASIEHKQSYELRGLPYGDYTISIPGFASDTVYVDGSVQYDFKLSSAVIQGSVADTTNRPLEGVHVQLVSVERADGPTQAVEDTASNQAGEFHVVAPGPGTYSVALSAKGYDTAFETVVASYASSQHRFRLEPIASGAAGKLRILDKPSGIALRNAYAYVETGTHARHFFELDLNESGEVSLPPSFSGHPLSVFWLGYEPERVIWNANDTLDVALTPLN